MKRLVLLAIVACSSPPKRVVDSPVASTPTPTAPRDTTPRDTAAWTWKPSGALATARMKHTATLLPDGRVLVAGGESDGYKGKSSWEAGETAEVWDPATNAWSSAGRLVERRYQHSATLLADGRVLVAGGYKLGDEKYLTSAEVWDPKTNKWTATGAMTEARAKHTATLLPDGRVLVTSGAVSFDVEIWNPKTGKWTVGGQMANQPQSPTATLLPDGRVLVCGQAAHAREATSEARSKAGTWSSAGTMVEQRYGHGAALLPDGRVLLVGGYADAKGTLASAELWDPGTSRWTATGSMTMQRMDATTTGLSDGRVVAAGGYSRSQDSESAAVATTEIWEPETGAWKALPKLATARFEHAAVALPDGRVLVVGGVTMHDQMKRDFLATTEIWGP